MLVIEGLMIVMTHSSSRYPLRIFILFIPAVLTKYIQVWNSHKTQLQSSRIGLVY